MNTKRFMFASIGAFVFIFIFEMLWHGFVMKGLYEATASVWRSEAEMNDYCMYMMASQAFVALALAFFYTKVGQHLPCKRGIMFGFLSGLLLAAPQFAVHAYLPIPLSIPLLWMLASVLLSIGACMIIAKIYKF